MSNDDSYDKIPYESTPFADTHPGHLACLAHLHGIEAAPPTKCRVLEFGCASGGNLIPMAAHLPDSRFVGIELSAQQAHEGQQRIAELGLENCDIHQGDLLTLTDDGQRYDYIITHGVYSWAPPAVRQRILELSAQLLADKGIAYVSYNTLPGWRTRATLRDMLLYRVRDITTPRARLDAATDYLQFLRTGLSGLEAVHVDFLKEEIERIENAHPSYLYHEYLETFNEPVLVSDFVSSANDHGLAYVCDIELGLQMPALLGDPIEQLLTAIEDPLERLQQTDFLLNRNFRQSLLCHDRLEPLAEPDVERLRDLALLGELHSPQASDLLSPEPQTFIDRQGREFELSEPLTRAAVMVLAEHYPRAVAYTDLLQQAKQRLASESSDEALLGEMFSLFAASLVKARPRDMVKLSPQLSAWQFDPVGRQGVLRGDQHVPTRHHDSLSLDAFSIQVIRYLDGKTDPDKLYEYLLADFAPGGVLAHFAPPNQPAEQLHRQLQHNLEHLLGLFISQGLMSIP